MERLSAAVVDSSVILKWFRPKEPLGQSALAIRQAYLDEKLELVIPDLAVYEVTNVLRYRASEVLATQAMESLFDLRIPIHRLSHQMIRQTLEGAFQHDVTVYDAAFLAVAKTLRLQLVTADHQFYRAIHRFPGVFFLADLKV
jgi:predicted nucleic acid-binding protein